MNLIKKIAFLAVAACAVASAASAQDGSTATGTEQNLASQSYNLVFSYASSTLALKEINLVGGAAPARPVPTGGRMALRGALDRQ